MEFHRSALRSFDTHGRLRMQVRVGGRETELTSADSTGRGGGVIGAAGVGDGDVRERAVQGDPEVCRLTPRTLGGACQVTGLRDVRTRIPHENLGVRGMLELESEFDGSPTDRKSATLTAENPTIRECERSDTCHHRHRGFPRIRRIFGFSCFKTF